MRSILARERDGAPSLWLEMARLPPDRQLDEIARDARFHTFGFCELLLAQAAAATADGGGAVAIGRTGVTEAGRLAGLALAAAERLDGAVHAAPVVYDLKARAWAQVGEAHRTTADLHAAEDALVAAAACLSHGTGDLLVDARLLEFEAAVRADQGRGGEAEALLRQAAARYAQVNEPDLAARATARREELRRAARSAPGSGHPAFGTNT